MTEYLIIKKYNLLDRKGREKKRNASEEIIKLSK